MGRAFEFRKERKMKRWAGMAKAFTRIGREISMSVKEGGGNPDNNPRLRMAMNNAKAANMPKTNVENAIKKATEKDSTNYDEIVYEGYGPHGIAILVETATDNGTRTVAHIRHAFSKNGGQMGTNGSVDYMFTRVGQFKIEDGGQDLEELELELIDAGLEEVAKDEDGMIVFTCGFTDFGNFGTALEAQGLEAKSAELVRLPQSLKALSDEQAEEVIKLIDILEEDDDVVNVFHTMDEGE
ncbi:MAG: YebC/PmpR family DNA-binding transcriptional regulator [Saprospiraceae bacterium]